jgi:hypothetical protein
MERQRPRLYWRIKMDDGKWRFVPAIYDLHRGQVAHPAGEKVTLWWPSSYEFKVKEEEE